jgi:CubicO group peptidase (beta-lactamase class C family)
MPPIARIALLVLVAASGPGAAQQVSVPTAPAGAGRGIDSLALGRLLGAAERAHSDAVVLWKDGLPAGAWYFGGQPRRIEAMSVTKSVVSLAVGRLITMGTIRSVDEPVHTFYPEWNQEPQSRITLRHLLDHTSGLQNVPDATVEIYPSRDFVRLALDAAVTDPPGTRFSYNNKAVNLLAGIVQKASGRQMDRFVAEELFAPLGIRDYAWALDSAGNPHAMAGLSILPEDLAKLGQLVLDRGAWAGRQLIAPEWFNQSLSPSRANPRYGLLWWLIPERGDFVIDDTHLEALRSAGADTAFLRLLGGMRGAYRSREELTAAELRMFGPDFREIIREGLRPAGMPIGRRETGPVAGYEANGYLGQYLVIYPDARLVAVRMIRGTRFTDPSTDGLDDFRDLVRALAPSR